MDSDPAPNQTGKSKGEPLDPQVQRRLLITVALTAVSSLIGTIMLLIFVSFGRLDVGLAVVGVLLVPIVLGAWAEFLVFCSRVNSFRRDPLADEKNDAPPA